MWRKTTSYCFPTLLARSGPEEACSVTDPRVQTARDYRRTISPVAGGGHGNRPLIMGVAAARSNPRLVLAVVARAPYASAMTVTKANANMRSRSPVISRTLTPSCSRCVDREGRTEEGCPACRNRRSSTCSPPGKGAARQSDLRWNREVAVSRYRPTDSQRRCRSGWRHLPLPRPPAEPPA